jgi:predicted metal-binding protein
VGVAVIDENVRCVQARRAELLRFYDPERIQGLCRSCDKYGRFWSCPPFAEAPLGKLPAWSDAVLVTQKTRVDCSSTQESLIEQFLSARQTLGDILKRWEVDGAVALIAGHCSGCAACPRSRGIACVAPDRMRYSLEGLGFDVTALVEALAGQKIDWPARGAPGHLLLAGALLCPSSEIAALIASQGN